MRGDDDYSAVRKSVGDYSVVWKSGARAARTEPGRPTPTPRGLAGREAAAIYGTALAHRARAVPDVAGLSA